MTPVDPLTLELLPDPTVVVSGAGVVLAANELAARLLGRPARELTGGRATQLLPLVDEAAADWWACGRPLDGDARLLARIPEVDLRLRLPGGRERPVTLTAARLPDERGGVALLVLSMRRGERRQRLDATRSELVSTVSHELRSPLTSVRGFTKTLLAKWDRFNDEQKQQMLRTMNADAERVTRLLGELLDVSRIDAGHLRLRRQMVDVGEVVDRVLTRVRLTAQERPIEASFPAGIPQLYADPDKVEQVFTNLVENAVPHGEGRVRVSAEVGDEQVRFTVSDEGGGIPGASQGHLFTKFYRSRGTRSAGTGLGLYITKGIVEAHGGQIWVDDTRAAGGHISFVLPRGGLELAGVPTAGTAVSG